MEEIFDVIPIIKYACDGFHIGRLGYYEVDERVQLVCKYLQAHSSKVLLSAKSKLASSSVWMLNTAE
jgi:hypothetical protein